MRFCRNRRPTPRRKATPTSASTRSTRPCPRFSPSSRPGRSPRRPTPAMPSTATTTRRRPTARSCADGAPGRQRELVLRARPGQARGPRPALARVALLVSGADHAIDAIDQLAAATSCAGGQDGASEHAGARHSVRGDGVLWERACGTAREMCLRGARPWSRRLGSAAWAACACESTRFVPVRAMRA